ncbi:MAG: cytidine deaminase [Mycoplasma sp.]
MNNIFKRLVELQKNSYAPYSKYPVACILIDKDNNEFEGVNVENASYGLTICAERNAITTACTNGSYEFKEVHLICGDDKEIFGTPCGACRQVLAEFMDDEALIISWNNIGQSQTFKFKELLPNCFRKSYFESK